MRLNVGLRKTWGKIQELNGEHLELNGGIDKTQLNKMELNRKRTDQIRA